MSMSTTAKEREFRFKDMQHAYRFVLLYQHLFVPYEEEICNNKRRYALYGRKNEGQDTVIFAKIEHEALMEILKTRMFSIEGTRRSGYKYVFEG